MLVILQALLQLVQNAAAYDPVILNQTQAHLISQLWGEIQNQFGVNPCEASFFVSDVKIATIKNANGTDLPLEIDLT